MKLKEAIVMQVAEGDIKQLWEHFNLLNEDDYPEFYEDYDNIRFGFRVKFSIFDLWTDKVYIKGKSVHVIDPDTLTKKSYKLEDFRTEKMQRKSLMRQRLYENMAAESMLEGR